MPDLTSFQYWQDLSGVRVPLKAGGVEGDSAAVAINGTPKPPRKITAAFEDEGTASFRIAARADYILHATAEMFTYLPDGEILRPFSYFRNVNSPPWEDNEGGTFSWSRSGAAAGDYSVTQQLTCIKGEPLRLVGSYEVSGSTTTFRILLDGVLLLSALGDSDGFDITVAAPSAAPVITFQCRVTGVTDGYCFVFAPSVKVKGPRQTRLVHGMDGRTVPWGILVECTQADECDVKTWTATDGPNAGLTVGVDLLNPRAAFSLTAIFLRGTAPPTMGSMISFRRADGINARMIVLKRTFQWTEGKNCGLQLEGMEWAGSLNRLS